MNQANRKAIEPSSARMLVHSLCYPADPEVLKWLGLIATASVLTLLPWVGLLFWLALWLLLFRMSYAILISSTMGRSDAPDVELEMPERIVLRHVGLMLVIALVYSALAERLSSAWLELLLGVLVMLIVPAAMMSLALSGRLLVALNPVSWRRVLRLTGPAYFPASALLLTALFAQSHITAGLEPIVGPWWWLVNMLAWFVSAWTLAAGFHLMGSLLHGPLVRNDFDESSADPLLQATRRRVAEGRTEEAIERLGREIADHGAQRPVHEYYRRLLREAGRQRELAEHARVFVSIMIHVEEDLPAAIDIASEALSIDPDFEPRDANDVLILVRHAFARNHHGLVGRLTRRFAPRHPTHPHQPELYFLAAQSLIEVGGDRMRAVRTVKALRKRYPDHALAGDMARFLASFDPDG